MLISAWALTKTKDIPVILVRVRVSKVVTTATYNDQDGVETFGTKSFTHNLNGEMVTSTDSASSTTTTYSFDVFGNLKSAVLPSKVISYKIDASNRRMAKLVDSNPVEYYIWNAEDKLIAIADENGIVTSRFVYGDESHSPDYMLTNTDSFQIIKNHLGSPVVVVNSSTGVVVQEVKYDEFGVVLSDTSPGLIPFGFAGCLYDQDTKLCKFGARDYDASIGRWLSKDPILFKGGDTNLYGYVLQDPINFIDPDGKSAMWLIAPVIAFEVGYDLGTFFTTLANTRSLTAAGREVYNRSPLRNLYNTGTGMLFPEYIGGPIQVFSNPDTMNAIIQRQQRTKKIDEQIGECK